MSVAATSGDAESASRTNPSIPAGQADVDPEERVGAAVGERAAERRRFGRRRVELLPQREAGLQRDHPRPLPVLNRERVRERLDAAPARRVGRDVRMPEVRRG